jgi:hypothetical protein
VVDIKAAVGFDLSTFNKKYKELLNGNFISEFKSVTVWRVGSVDLWDHFRDLFPNLFLPKNGKRRMVISTKYTPDEEVKGGPFYDEKKNAFATDFVDAMRSTSKGLRQQMGFGSNFFAPYPSCQVLQGHF